MQFGMPTLIETKNLETCSALCHELKLDFIELNMNMPEYQVEKLDIKLLQKIADDNGIYYTIHFDENLNPCDFNHKVAQAYTETVLQTIEIAKLLSVPVLNMHLSEGVYFTLPDKKVFLFSEYEDDYLEKLATFKDKCTTAIDCAEIKICVENSSGYNRAQFLQKGLDLLLESSVFGLTFDIGHNASIGFADESVIMEREDKLCHMHIHDAKGKNNHLSMGEGELNMVKYLKLAKEHNCRAVLEIKTVTGLRQSVAWLKERRYL